MSQDKNITFKRVKRSVPVAFILIAMSTLIALSAAQAKSTPELDQALEKLMPGTQPSSIEETGMPGIYEVSFGSTIFYFNKDATMMLRGDLIDVKNRTNLTEKKRGEARGKLISQMDESQMIVYPAKNEKHKVTVFTDIDCPYCVKLHRDMKQYNDEGITMRYMAYPRAGIGSNSYKKIVNVWCSDDKAKAMTDAKEGESIANKTCDNPVAQQYQLGQALGVQGTPAMFMQDGTSLPGYVPPKRLAEALKNNAQ